MPTGSCQIQTALLDEIYKNASGVYATKHTFLKHGCI